MSIKAQTSFSLADQLFNKQTVAQLVAGLAVADAKFNKSAFTRRVLHKFPSLELKARIDWIVECLHSHMPVDFDRACDVLLAALPEPLDPTLSDDDFGRFIWVVPGEYVAKYGCAAEHLDKSLATLRETTKRFSAENAIRPFLTSFPAETMSFVRKCALDSNYHVRRLASEGTRPFLPWAPRVDLDPAQVVLILDRLHSDPTRYVTRSVANSLNDFAKTDPALVVEALRRWRQQALQNSVELDWLSKHSLRTLLKNDHAAALELLGYPLAPKFRLSGVETSKVVRVGEALRWQGLLTSTEAQRLKINLRIEFLKSNGRHNAKVFAVKDAVVGAGERLQIDKRQNFKPMTTRVLYPGTHYVTLVVNGVARQRQPFELVV